MDPARYSGMRSTFHDEDHTPYDDAIKTSREAMQNQGACGCEQEVGALIHRLNQMHTTYTRRPCVPGFCFGLMIPHRSRIAERVDAFVNEKKLHNEQCKEEKGARDHERNKELKQMEIDAQIKRYKDELTARSRASKTTTERGIFPG